MLVVRLLAVLTLLVVAVAVGAYLVTGQVRYRQFAWRTFKLLIAVGLVFLILLFLERIFVPLV